MGAKNILILSYFFPPCNKVGGRRWAKFGKYLSAKNHNIYVISVNVPHSGPCPWEDDIRAFRSNISRLPYIEHRPFYQVNKRPEKLTGKLRYRLSWYKHKLTSKSAYTDISAEYHHSLFEKAGEIIKTKKIQTVIITGGPFHWCYSAIHLKDKFPELNFLVDLRDFWTGGDTYSKIKKHEQIAEDKKELKCIAGATWIFTPADRIADYLKNKYPAYESKIITLPHAFDSDEMPEKTNVPTPKEVLTFAYGGILYSNMEPAMMCLIQLLQHLINSGQKVKVDIYTFNKEYEELFINAGLGEVVFYHKTIPAKQLFDVFLGTDYLLQLRASEAQEQHFKSTKFYELIALRKPIVYFGPEGDVSDFLQKNKLGFSGNTSPKELGAQLLSNKISRQIPDPAFDVSQFEYKRVTEQLENYL